MNSRGTVRKLGPERGIPHHGCFLPVSQSDSAFIFENCLNKSKDMHPESPIAMHPKSKIAKVDAASSYLGGTETAGLLLSIRRL